MDTNDLEVAAVLAQGQSLGSGQMVISAASSSYSPRRSSTVLTNNSRGNIAAGTPSKSGFESLHQLAAKGELLILQDSVVDDCQLNEQDDHSLTPLMWAAMYGQTDITNFLLQSGATPDMYNEDGSTSLMLACYHGNHGVVQALLDHGVDIDQVDREGNSALMYAVFSDQVECTRLLLEGGADLTQRNLQEHTPMDAAVKLKHKHVQKCLEMYLIKCLSYS